MFESSIHYTQESALKKSAKVMNPFDIYFFINWKYALLLYHKTS